MKQSVSSNLLVNLNEQQRAAVTHGSGPLLVVAGAGTGKTKMLTHRIAWLIQEGIAKPEEILALTFTDKAAGEMETRLDQLLPYGQTQTTINTFHAFGDALLREHALDVDLPPEFRVLGQAEQELFLSERFDEIEGLEVLRPVSSPRRYIGPILQVISRAKDELVTPDRYTDVAAEFMRAAKDDDEQLEARRQQELALIYAAYESFKAERGVIDFGDQVLLLSLYLRTHPKVLTTLQARYKYILVDEFQDTNIAQYTVVKQLLDDNQNLTVVGDDDQAIYKFRGAAVSNILGFLADFPGATQVVLTQNYRSTQAILDAAYQLIAHNNPDRLEAKLKLDKHLVGQAPGERPTFHWYSHEADELDGLVSEIQQLTKNRPLRDIAVLVRSNTLITTVASKLEKAGIVFTSSHDQAFTARPEIRGLIAFLTVLAHPDNSLAHLKLTLSPYYELKPEWVLLINDAAKKANRPFEAVLQDDTSVAWSRLSTEGKSALEAYRDDLGRARALIGTKNPGEIVYQFLKDRGILQREVEQSTAPQQSLFVQRPEAERMAMIANIAAVFEAISGYMQAGRDMFAIRFVDQLEELLQTITPPNINAGPDVDALQLMTVHASKGLEWPVVFLPSLMADRFPARRRASSLELPEALIVEQLPTGDEHLQEERRLMYVALTRAKETLILSGAAKTGSGVRTKKVSPFVIESLQLTNDPEPVERVSHAHRLESFAPKPPVVPTLSYQAGSDVLFLSPAAIETYLRDPYDFYWKYVLKAPQPPSRHLVYGNAIHSAIEAYYLARRSFSSEVKEGRSEGISSEVDNRVLNAVLDRYAEAWKSEGFESQVDENRQFEHGQETLRRFIARADTEAEPEQVEYGFILPLPGVKIRGRVDAVFTSSGEIRDFKTSRVETQKDADKKIKENIPIRIYALAYQQAFGRLPTSLVLDFVEHDLKASIIPSQSLLDETKQLVADAVAGIRAGHFDPDPSNPFKDYDA